MNFSELAIGGVAIIPLVIGLVQLLKNLGVTGNKLTYCALGIGGLAGLLYKLYLMFPITQQVIEVIVFVVACAIYAIAATGIYDLVKPIVEASKLQVNAVKNLPPVTTPAADQQVGQRLDVIAKL